MKTPLLVIVGSALLLFSCIKEQVTPVTSEIEGQLLIWDAETPVVFDPDNPPMIELYELEYVHSGDVIQPSQTSKRRIAEVAVDADGFYYFKTDLNPDVEYFLNAFNFDTSRFFNMINHRVRYEEKQTLNTHLVAVSWVTPRFINQTNLPGDTFTYISGIGGDHWIAPLTGASDTTMSWFYRTWGGMEVVSKRHLVYGTLSRNGVSRDTTIYYYVPPGDTSIVEIRW